MYPQKVAELSEILADRESKIMDLSKVNLEMREKNQELRQKFEVNGYKTYVQLCAKSR